MNKKGPRMKRKHILIVLLVLLAVLAIAVVAASVYLFYYVPQVMDAQEKRINIVRYIGLCQTDEFYDEVMSMPASTSFRRSSSSPCGSPSSGIHSKRMAFQPSHGFSK